VVKQSALLPPLQRRLASLSEPILIFDALVEQAEEQKRQREVEEAAAAAAAAEAAMRKAEAERAAREAAEKQQMAAQEQVRGAGGREEGGGTTAGERRWCVGAGSGIDFCCRHVAPKRCRELGCVRSPRRQPRT